MQSKPILTIKNFAGMEDNGCYWCESMSIKKVNGESVLRPEWYAGSFLHSDLTGFTNMQVLNGLATINFDIDGYCLAVSNQYMFVFHSIGASSYQGEAHSLSGATQSTYPDIILTGQSNFLYSSANHLGLGYRGQCKTGSGTTKIIDTDGRNFAGVTHVYNIKNKESYTVTSVTTTTAANDTLNFNAGTANAAGDWFICFIDAKFSFHSTTVQYKGQESSTTWKRQIKLWGSTFYILNGNYLAALSATETTWTTDVLSYNNKQFPTNSQGLCFDINQDRALISCDCNGRGKLLLWDGYSTNWTNILDIESPARAMVSYKNGWLYTMGYSIYWTDGYNIQFVTKLLDSRITNYFGGSFNSMKMINGLLFLSLSPTGSGRQIGGNYVYDFENGWIYFPSYGTGRFASGGNVFYVYYGELPVILTSNSDNSAGSRIYTINRIYQSQPSECSYILHIKLPQKINIKMIELSLGTNNIDFDRENSSTSVTVNYGDGNYTFLSKFKPVNTSTYTILNNSDGNKTFVKTGMLLRVQSGANGWQRSYVESIDAEGTTNEAIHLTSALTNLPSNLCYVYSYNLYSAGVKTINVCDIDRELLYNVPSFYSDSLYLEVHMKTAPGSESDNSIKPDLLGINIY